MRRRIVLPLALLTLAFFTLSCDAADEALLAPDDAVAKGKPPKDTGTKPENLVEYYVIPSSNGIEPNIIHVVVDGDAEKLGTQMVYDYFFNGARDDNDSPHYEYFVSAKYDEVVVTTTPEGYTQLEATWSGNYADPVYECTETKRGESCEYLGTNTVPHVDQLATAVPVAGGYADPYAFAVSVYDANDNYLAGWQPQGVVLGGETLGPEATVNSPDGTLAVTSYALFAAEPATNAIWVESMSAGTPTCTYRTIHEGRGKNRTSKDVTELSIPATAVFAGTTSDAKYWTEFHVRPTTVDYVMDNRPSSGPSGTVGDDEDFTVTSAFMGFLPDHFQVELVMDYLYYTGPALNGTYDFTSNTNLGFQTLNGAAVKVGDPWPEVVIGPFDVTCH